jgi:hypothetical protein
MHTVATQAISRDQIVPTLISMRPLKTFLTTLLFFTFAAYAPQLSSSVSTPSADLRQPLRQPFLLELPGTGMPPITEAEARIPTSNLQEIRFKVLKPFADSIDTGKIYTKINGEAAGTIQYVSPSREGYIVLCRLDEKPRFRLHPGKNIVEISAIDTSKQQYYASYVLLTGAGAVDDSILAAGGALESNAVTTGADREPPAISLIDPKGPVQSSDVPVKLRVHGMVSDNSGAVASVTVNGQPASLSAGTRGMLVRPNAGATQGAKFFDYAVTLTAQTSSVVVEAKDGAGNLARLLIPVLRREGAVSSQFSGKKFAIIIGVSRYKYTEGGFNNLDYADADARSMRDFLLQTEGGKFDQNNILYLENEQATLNAVRGALNEFLPKAGPNDLIFVFLAGHGGPDPYSPQNLYFVMHDTRVSDMPGTALLMTELQEALNGARAKRKIVFIDTCHSAGLSGKEIVKTRAMENNLINFYAARLFTEAGSAVLTSSDINEVSQESKKWGGGHGIFTFALLEGFGGKADADNDKFITAGELFAYVRERVREATNSAQNPRALPGLSASFTLAFVNKKG